MIDDRQQITPEEKVARLFVGAAISRQARADSVRVTPAHREAGNAVGELLTEFVWRGGCFERIPASSEDSGASIALSVAAQVRATGSGFGVALAEWLEKWAREELDSA